MPRVCAIVRYAYFLAAGFPVGAAEAAAPTFRVGLLRRSTSVTIAACVGARPSVVRRPVAGREEQGEEAQEARSPKGSGGHASCWVDGRRGLELHRGSRSGWSAATACLPPSAASTISHSGAAAEMSSLSRGLRVGRASGRFAWVRVCAGVCRPRCTRAAGSAPRRSRRNSAPHPKLPRQRQRHPAAG